MRRLAWGTILVLGIFSICGGLLIDRYNHATAGWPAAVAAEKALYPAAEGWREVPTTSGGEYVLVLAHAIGGNSQLWEYRLMAFQGTGGHARTALQGPWYGDTLELISSGAGYYFQQSPRK